MFCPKPSLFQRLIKDNTTHTYNNTSVIEAYRWKQNEKSTVECSQEKQENNNKKQNKKKRQTGRKGVKRKEKIAVRRSKTRKKKNKLKETLLKREIFCLIPSPMYSENKHVQCTGKNFITKSKKDSPLYTIKFWVKKKREFLFSSFTSPFLNVR